MRERIKKITIVCAFFALFYFSLYSTSFLFHPTDNNPDDGLIDWKANSVLAEPVDTIDAVMIGDSVTFCSYNPIRVWETQGVTSYVCGSNRQLLSYSEEFLHKVFKNQNPKIVMLETNCIFRHMDLYNETRHNLKFTFSTFVYHNRWKTLKIEDLSKPFKYSYVNEEKGYYYSDIIDGTYDYGYMSDSSARASILGKNKDYVKKIKSYCDAHGAELKLVSVPSTVNYNMKRHNALQALSEKLNVEYIDLNLNVISGEIQIDWQRDTRDKGDHLNVFGAEKVSAYLGQYLRALGLDDHRGDEKFAPWNECVEKFNKKIEAVNI